MQYLIPANKIIIGIDEAGRGPLLGRIYAAAVIITDRNPEIKDSKKLSEKSITKLADYIRKNAIAFSICYITEKEIDEINILQATMKAMQSCILQLNKCNTGNEILCIDGTYFKGIPEIKQPFICISKGDSLIYEISCAGILAKDARDTYIRELCISNPILILYNISGNKGYGSKAHIDAINKYGITEFHRKTFAPCKNFTCRKIRVIPLQK